MRGALFFIKMSIWVLVVGFIGSASILTVCVFWGSSFAVEWQVLSLSGGSVTLSFSGDLLSAGYMSVVLFIAICIFTFSLDYMKGDPHVARFIIILLVFVACMGLLVYIPNFCTVLLGWDGLGLSSYILVVYYGSPSSVRAGMTTALSNRVGDMCLLGSVGVLVGQGHWLISCSEGAYVGGVASVLVCVACMTKSAQFPFSAWLPAAMAAPTPVSALVHSSTLVTAGVYMMVRVSGFMAPGGAVAELLLFFAGSTTVMAGVCALYEHDMKKIIALSTLSQLGFMMLAVGASQPMLAYFHMVTHALFKALMFLCVGSIILTNMGDQDLRGMKSKLWCDVPVSSASFMVAAISLCGVPYSSGYYSKDLILESVGVQSQFGWESLGASVGSGLTMAYTVRVFVLLFFTGAKDSVCVRLVVKEGWSVLGPCIFMSFMSLVCGYTLYSCCTGFSFITPCSFFHKVLFAGSGVAGVAVWWALPLKIGKTGKILKSWEDCCASMFFLDTFTCSAAPGVVLGGAERVMLVLDQGWLEVCSVGVGESVVKKSVGWTGDLQKSSLGAYPFMVLMFFMNLYVLGGVVN